MSKFLNSLALCVGAELDLINIIFRFGSCYAHCVIIYHCIINLVDHPCMSLCSCHFRSGILETVKYLVQNANVNINAKDLDGYTPLDLARQ